MPFRWKNILQDGGVALRMPIKKIKAKTEFLRRITKALEQAEKGGVRDPLQLIRKVLDTRLRYKDWKEGQKR